MASVKIILRKETKADGTSPLAIRITKDRRTSYIYLDYSIPATQWDKTEQRIKKSHPNSVRLNNYLLKKLAEVNNSVIETETQKEYSSAKTLKQVVKPTGGSTFFGQAQVYLDFLKGSGKYNQYTADKPRVKHFREFIGNDIPFQDISPALLERFKSHLKTNRNLSERSAVNALVMVRSVFSHAFKSKVIDEKHYPFGKGKIKIKFPDSNKIGLTPEEVKRIERVDLSNADHHHARNLWLISFYFAGMRVSDVLRLRWSDLQDNRLNYTMGKNNKGGSLKIPEKAIKIIKDYRVFRENIDDLIFPELKECNFENAFETQRTIAFKTSALDKCLRNNVAPAAGIDKKLTMHIARHTFGNISGDKISIQMLQKLYRHSSITTTIGYQQNFIHKDVDSALDNVLDF